MKVRFLTSDINDCITSLSKGRLLSAQRASLRMVYLGDFNFCKILYTESSDFDAASARIVLFSSEMVLDLSSRLRRLMARISRGEKIIANVFRIG